VNKLRSLFLLFFLIPLFDSHAEVRVKKYVYKVIKVIDGDTIAINDNNRPDEKWRYQPVRLIGIDAPESRENPKMYRDLKRNNSSKEKILSLGEKSSNYLKNIIKPGDEVELEFDVSKTDQYRKRWYAYVYLSDGTFLNEKLAKDGFVLQMTVPPNTRYAEKFSQAILEAKQNNKGLWANGLS